MVSSRLDLLNREIVACRKCPRLVAYREEVARRKVRRYRHEDYWGKPLPGFGDPAARILIVGLAPAAHGGNRTGRIFTGDRSGDWLYEALYLFGFANQPTSVALNDGLSLKDVYVTAAVRCAPPDNRPTQQEKSNCRPYLERELQLLRSLRVMLVLGSIALDSCWKAARQRNADLCWLEAGSHAWRHSRPPFGHAKSYRLSDETHLVCSYHPSQQNTQTGRLTRPMFHQVFKMARGLM